MLTLTALKSEITADKKYNELDSKSWETKLHERAVDVKFDDVFEQLIPMYVSKIDALRAYLMDDESGIKIAPFTTEGKLKSDYEVYQEFVKKADEYHYAQTKEQRLLDKLACCLKEQELRAAKLVTREPHHTTYYCDYTNGNDANDGLSADNAHSWKTINKYTTTTVRTAGDILLVRANQTHDCSGADIVFDEDGDLDNWIYIIGCDATTNDPWNDDSNVKPIIDFGDAAYQILLSDDTYWWLERLDVRQSADTEGQIRTSSTSARLVAYLKDIDVSDGGNSSTEGFQFIGAFVTLDGCTVIDSWGSAIRVSSATLMMINCLIDKGSVRGCLTGINIVGGTVYAYNCAFGSISDFRATPIVFYNYGGNTCLLRNCAYTGAVLLNTNNDPYDGLFLEDDDGVYGSHGAYYYHGNITRQTDSPRAGGSASYAQMTSNAKCGLNQQLMLGNPLNGFAPKWLTKDVEYTVTVYARVGSAWDSALNASEAYLKCSYLSNASTAARTEIQSTETIANDTTWTAFTVTFTPLQTGFAYFWFYLAKYEDASEYIDVDDEPVVS